jgi:hypothetical protein
VTSLSRNRTGQSPDGTSLSPNGPPESRSRIRPKNPVVPPPLHSPPVLEKSVSVSIPLIPPLTSKTTECVTYGARRSS